MDLQLSNAVSHVTLWGLIISKSLFEICFQKKKIFGKQKMKFVSISVRVYAIFHFWKTALDFKNVQNSMKVLKITKPRRITCDTALESWRSILFDEKVFCAPQKFFTPLFFTWVKKFLNFWKSHNFCSCEKKGGKKLLRGVKNFDFYREHSQL